jgi:hypothetical protein
LAILTTDAALSLLNYCQTRFLLSSPLIPSYVIEQIAQPYFTHAIFELIAAIIALLFFFKYRFQLTIGISVFAIIVDLFI